MASHSSIYNWKRQENKPVFSSRGNVQEWVKQVQKACDDAAQDIFGDNAHEMLGRRDYYVDDDAILEGQDLIDSWIQKRDVDDLLAECEILDEVPTTSLAQYDKLSERFHYHPDSSTLLDSPPSYYEDDQVNVQKPVFDLDEDFDEECAVHEVVYNMLERDVVDLNSVNADEMLFKSKTTKFKDPTPKMKLRHEQVKKRANQRKTAWEKENLKKMNERTVEEEARKQIQREEKRRLDNIKREEDEIRNEMVKIRRVMQEENAQRAILHSREAESDEKATKLAKIEVRKQQEENEQRLRQEYEAKATIKKKLLKQQEEEEMRKREDLKVIQSCFSSWYALVVNKQIKCGKARALLEWRRKLRIWNAWRTYVLRSRSDRETRALNEQMKERHRKEVLADRFYRQMLFHRCLTAWLSWVEKAKEEKILKEQHDKRAEKMAILLKAASSGQLWQETKIEDEERSRTERDSHAFDEEEISLKPFKLQDLPRTATQESRNCSVSKTRSKKENTTKQAWPHQRLKEMKNRKPAKKQNALLANIGSITTRTESSTTATQSNDNPRVEHSNIPEKEISQRAPSSNSKNVNLRSQSGPRSNVVQNSASETLEQKVVDTDRNIGQAQKVVEFSRDNVNTRKHYVAVESSEPPQSARSTATTSTLKVTSRKPPTKPLHLAMEERAKARAERKSFLDSKKKVAEEEKLMKLKQEQEEKEKEIFAEKQAASQRKKEEMKLARQRELEKQQRLDEMRRMKKKADEHYHNTLLRDFGFLPWAKLIQTRDEMMNNAQVFYKKNLQSSCFREWLTYTRSECKRRNQLADNMYESLLLRFGWLSWRKYRNHLAEMDRIAFEFSRRYVVKKYVKIWQDFVIEERLLGWDKENKADEHNDKRLLHKAMTYWKKYIPLLREEEKREKRRNNLRKHVTSLLPDFQNLHLNHSP